MPEIAEESVRVAEDALRECQELFLLAKIEADRNAYIQGRLTSVSILNLPKIPGSSLRQIEIVCHASGHLNVEWDRLYLIPKDGSLDMVLVRPSGRASLETTPETEFPIEFEGFSIDDLLVFPEELKPEMVGVKCGDPGVEFGDLKLQDFDFRTSSGRLQGQLQIVKGPRIQIKIEAHESLRGRKLEIQFRSKDRKLMLRALMDLKYENDLAGAWESTPEDIQAITEPARVIVRLLPKR